MLARPVDSEIVADRASCRTKCSLVMIDSADARERRALRAARAGILRICSHERFNCYYGLGIRAVSDLRLRSLVSFIARSYTAVLRLGSRSTS